MRLGCGFEGKKFLGFNPRICKRCDCGPHYNECFARVSIHASVKDATEENAQARAWSEVSIHASVKDATGETRELRFIYQVSIHASVKDAT